MAFKVKLSSVCYCQFVSLLRVVPESTANYLKSLFFLFFWGLLRTVTNTVTSVLFPFPVGFASPSRTPTAPCVPSSPRPTSGPCPPTLKPRCEAPVTPVVSNALPLPPPASGVPLLLRGWAAGGEPRGAGPGRGRVPSGAAAGARSLAPRRRTRVRRRLGGASAALLAAAGGGRRAMEGNGLNLSVLSLAVLLLAAASGGAELPPSCEGVRKVFQLRRLGPLRGIPEFPRAGMGRPVGTERARSGEGQGLPCLGAGAAGLNSVPPAVMSGWCRRPGCSSAGHLSVPRSGGPGSLATSRGAGVILVAGAAA